MAACIDLHIHSNASDGSDAPAHIAHMAAELRLQVFALTDHDTLKGLEEAETSARALGVPFVRGCEVSTATPWGEAHFLGLWIPHDLDRIAELRETLASARKNRIERGMRIAEKLRSLGLPVDFTEVAAFAGGAIGRPHFAELLCRKGVVKTCREAFVRYLGEGRPAYVPRKLLKPEEAVPLLRRAGALVSFAHPCLFKGPPETLEKLLASLAPLGLDAVEAYHSEHSVGDVRLCLHLARKYGLHVTGGSDYHGAAKPLIGMGHGKGSLCVPCAIYEDLLRYREERGLLS